MKTTKVFEAIAELNLDPIKTKLMHAASGEGWSRAKADAIALEYRRFLYLMHTFPNEQIAPTVDVDVFWHYHILDTMKYAADCEQLFGYFLHHYPYVELDTAAEDGAAARGGQRMQELYEQTFGEDYIRPGVYGPLAAQDVKAHAAYCMKQDQEPDQVQAGGAGAAYCMKQGQIQAGAAAAAYCMKQHPACASGADTAYCMKQDQARAGGATAAYCMKQQPASGAAMAYCMKQTPVKASGSQVAYCMKQSPAQLDDADFDFGMLHAQRRGGRGPSPVVPV